MIKKHLAGTLKVRTELILACENNGGNFLYRTSESRNMLRLRLIDFACLLRL
jgi:hypothetical protein